MRLLDDVNLPQSLSEESLGSDLEGATLDDLTKGNKISKMESMLIPEDDNEDNGIFNFGKSINTIR